MFSTVHVTESNRRSADTRAACVVSTDETPRAREPFCVSYDNTDSTLKELHYQDVPRSRVIFPTVALAANSSSTSHLSEYVLPTSFSHSQTYPDAPLWLEATQAEVDSFIEKGVILPMYGRGRHSSRC